MDDRKLRGAEIKIMRQEDILKCPYAIIMPAHYRNTGSCRCNDPTHTIMRDWGYTWDKTTKRWKDIPNEH